MTRTTKAPAAKPAESTDKATAPTLNLSVRRSEGVQRATKVTEPNPTEEALKATLTEGALAYDVDSEEEAKRVVSLLQRAAGTLKVGLTKSITKHPNGKCTVDFKATATKRVRKYTHLDIRNWARNAQGHGPQGDGWGEITGPLPKVIREAFKVANGYAKAE